MYNLRRMPMPTAHAPLNAGFLYAACVTLRPLPWPPNSIATNSAYEGRPKDGRCYKQTNQADIDRQIVEERQDSDRTRKRVRHSDGHRGAKGAGDSLQWRDPVDNRQGKSGESEERGI
jgi:hypothetical protein